MKFTYAAALATAVFASGSMSQDLSGLPSCAEAAAIGGIGATGCAITDIACICKSSAFIATVSKDIQTACSAADQAKTLAFAQKLCSSVGVTIPGPSATTTAVVTSTAAESSSSSSVAAVSTAAVSSTAEVSTTLETSSVEPSASTTIPVVYSTPETASTTSTKVVVAPTGGSNSTSVSGSNSTVSGVTTGTPSPTFVNGASAAKAVGVLLSVVVAGVAALNL